MRKTPRDYQEWAHASTWSYMHDPANFEGGTATNGLGPKNPLIVEATGLGKSLNIAMLIWHMKSSYPGVRILQLCHVKELVESNHEELSEFCPHIKSGVYAASLGQRDTRHDVIFAMINSVAKKASAFGKVDVVIVDEAHRLSDNDASLYGIFLAELRKVNPRLVVVGYTATDYRMKGGRLTEMDMFDDVVYDIGSGESFLWAIEQGYLIRPVPVDPGFQLDESGIGIAAGDYKNKEASAALHEQNIIERAVDYSIQVAREQNRKCAITFAQSIEDADLIADMFTYKGFPTEAVHSKMKENRDDILNAHKSGELFGVTNKDILTTGWNNPRLDLFVGLRLTRSAGLWVQMVGRLTRPIWLPGYDISTKEGRWESIRASGKTTGLVLDFCANTERLGAVNYPNVPGRRKKGGGGGEAPVRKCSQHKNKDGEMIGCKPATYHHTSVKICPDCGHEFPSAEKFKAFASSDALVLDIKDLPPPPEKTEHVYSVYEMLCQVNAGRKGKREDKAKPDTLRVRYRTGYDSVSAWICFDHPEGSWAKKSSTAWWKQHSGGKPVPATVAEAVERSAELQMPKFIKVEEGGEFNRIKGYDFVGTKFEIDLTSAEPKIYDQEPDPMNYNPPVQGSSHSGGYYELDDDIPF